MHSHRKSEYFDHLVFSSISCHDFSRRVISRNRAFSPSIYVSRLFSGKFLLEIHIDCFLFGRILGARQASLELRLRIWSHLNFQYLIFLQGVKPLIFHHFPFSLGPPTTIIHFLHSIKTYTRWPLAQISSSIFSSYGLQILLLFYFSQDHAEIWSSHHLQILQLHIYHHYLCWLVMEVFIYLFYLSGSLLLLCSLCHRQRTYPQIWWLHVERCLIDAVFGVLRLNLLWCL